MSMFNRQRGHAAILFVMIIPALFGLFALGSDGARALQAKARLSDGLESATLAVTAHSSDVKATNNAIVHNYMNEYMQDAMNFVDIDVVKRTCELIPDCMEGLDRGEMRFFEYQVMTRSEHLSWFPGTESIVGLGDTFLVSDTSL